MHVCDVMCACRCAMCACRHVICACIPYSVKALMCMQVICVSACAWHSNHASIVCIVGSERSVYLARLFRHVRLGSIPSHIPLYIRTYAFLYTYMCLCIYTHMLLYIHTYAFVYTYICLSGYIHMPLYIHTHMPLYIHTHMPLYIHTYAFVYTYCFPCSL